MAFKIMNRNSNFSNFKEGHFTREVEKRTASIPSSVYLSLAIGSMAVSALLEFYFKRKQTANFIGLWVPSILIMGLYNKLVKLEGHDRQMM